MIEESKKSGGTDIGRAIVEANNDLNVRKRRFPDYMSCIFVISDGDTFGALQGEKLTRFVQGLEAYGGKKMGKHLKMGFFLRGGGNLSEADKAAPTPMEQYFGPREKGGTVVVDDFDELVSKASKALKKTLKKMVQAMFR